MAVELVIRRSCFHDEDNTAIAFRPEEQDEMMGAEVKHGMDKRRGREPKLPRPAGGSVVELSRPVPSDPRRIRAGPRIWPGSCRRSHCQSSDGAHIRPRLCRQRPASTATAARSAARLLLAAALRSLIGATRWWLIHPGCGDRAFSLSAVFLERSLGPTTRGRRNGNHLFGDGGTQHLRSGE